MPLVRTVKQENPFVQLDKYFLNDDRLSWSAKGILAYLLSKPDGWKINKEDLIKRSNDGKAKVESALLNLMSCGYINWYQLKEEDGTFGEWIYDVYERPEFNPNLDLCIKEGQERIHSRKNQVKKKNESKKNSPTSDNPPSDKSKADYPKADYPTSDNPPYNNNDFNNNDFNNNKKIEEEEETLTHLSILTNFFIQNISPAGRQVIESKFAIWLKKLSFDVIKQELEHCVLHGGKSWPFVETCLEKLKAANVTTIEQQIQLHAEYKEKKSVKTPNHKGNRQKSKRSEILPDWVDEYKEDINNKSADNKPANRITIAEYLQKKKESNEMSLSPDAR